MGSVMSDVVCKKCKFPFAMEDYYYKSGEVWVFCDRCGYCYEGFYKRKNGKIVEDKNGKWIPIENSTGGCGAFHELSERGGGTGGHFQHKWDLKRWIKKAKKWLRRHPDFKGKFLYTKKERGHWMIFNVKTRESVNLPDNIGFQLFLFRKNGDFSDYRQCPSCKGEGGLKLSSTQSDSFVNCSECKGKGYITKDNILWSEAKW